MQQWLICLDLDGTILDDASQLSEANRACITNLRRQGHLVSVVTGRNAVDMLPRKDLYAEVDYVVLNSGGRVTDVATGEDVFDEVIDRDVACRLIDFALAEGIRLYVMMGRHFACTDDGPGVMEYAAEAGVTPTILKSCADLPDKPIEGFVVINARAEIEAFIDRENLPLNSLGSEPDCTDVVSDKTDKWVGIHRLRDYLSQHHLPVLAIGNFDNDCHMVEHADLGMAVANASPALKEVADYVTRRTNNEDVMVEVTAYLTALLTGEDPVAAALNA